MLKKSTLLFLSVFLLLIGLNTPSYGDHNGKQHGGKGGGGGGGKVEDIKLKVHLSGAFVFDTPENNPAGDGVLEVSWNQKGPDDTTSAAKVIMIRPKDGGDGGDVGTCAARAGDPDLYPISFAKTWDDAFCACSELVENPPTGFSVEPDEWVLHIDTVEIQLIGFNFEYISLPDGLKFPGSALVHLQLISDPNEATWSFPPPSNEMIEIPLVQFGIGGRTAKGFKPRATCGGQNIQPLGDNSSTLSVCGAEYLGPGPCRTPGPTVITAGD